MRRSTKIQLALLNNLVWVMVAAFFLFNSVFTPSFLSSRNLLNILFQSATLGLMVLGQGIVMTDLCTCDSPDRDSGRLL